TGCASNSGSKLVPAFTVFHSPPEAEPMYQMFLFEGTTAMLVILPLMPAGPMLRSGSWTSGWDSTVGWD
ncbi:MAG: hypothetical protein NWQ45_10485, partial [Congregibacter sp.]|nr:hypothetical protein [Congregibacter sp.]